jgi:hypothetical protein
MVTGRAIVVIVLMIGIITMLTMISLSPKGLFLFVLGVVSGVVLYHLLTIEE